MQLAFTTADELFALLEREGEALDYRDVWPRLFPVGPCSFGLMRALVEDIVANDERFTWESDVHVGLAHWRTAHRDLSTVAFTVVDLETTGSTPGFAKITEIGAVRVEHGQQIATFSQLVNPQTQTHHDVPHVSQSAVAPASTQERYPKRRRPRPSNL